MLSETVSPVSCVAILQSPQYPSGHLAILLLLRQLFLLSFSFLALSSELGELRLLCKDLIFALHSGRKKYTGVQALSSSSVGVDYTMLRTSLTTGCKILESW